MHAMKRIRGEGGRFNSGSVKGRMHGHHLELHGEGHPMDSVPSSNESSQNSEQKFSVQINASDGPTRTGAAPTLILGASGHVSHLLS